MFVTKSLLIIGIICISNVICDRVVCDLEDSKCLTETAGLTFEQFIDGIPGVESSEPLYQKEIEAKLPTLYYKFTDAKLSGLKKCKVELVKISAKDLKYDYHVGCPHLTMEAKYEINGEIGPNPVKGQGDCKIDFYDYLFLFHGDYVSKEGAEGKTHINLKTHTLEVQNNGKAVYEFKNLFDGDKELSDVVHKWVNENSQLVEKGSGKPTWDAFMGNKYLSNVNAHLGIVSVKELFSKEK